MNVSSVRLWENRSRVLVADASSDVKSEHEFKEATSDAAVALQLSPRILKLLKRVPLASISVKGKKTVVEDGETFDAHELSFAQTVLAFSHLIPTEVAEIVCRLSFGNCALRAHVCEDILAGLLASDSPDYFSVIEALLRLSDRQLHRTTCNLLASGLIDQLAVSSKQNDKQVLACGEFFKLVTQNTVLGISTLRDCLWSKFDFSVGILIGPTATRLARSVVERLLVDSLSVMHSTPIVVFHLDADMQLAEAASVVDGNADLQVVARLEPVFSGGATALQKLTDLLVIQVAARVKLNSSFLRTLQAFCVDEALRAFVGSRALPSLCSLLALLSSDVASDSEQWQCLKLIIHLCESRSNFELLARTDQMIVQIINTRLFGNATDQKVIAKTSETIALVGGLLVRLSNVMELTGCLDAGAEWLWAINAFTDHPHLLACFEPFYPTIFHSAKYRQHVLYRYFECIEGKNAYAAADADKNRIDQLLVTCFNALLSIHNLEIMSMHSLLQFKCGGGGSLLFGWLDQRLIADLTRPPRSQTHVRVAELYYQYRSKICADYTTSGWSPLLSSALGDQPSYACLLFDDHWIATLMARHANSNASSPGERAAGIFDRLAISTPYS